jgi:hypothetical protein
MSIFLFMNAIVAAISKAFSHMFCPNFNPIHPLINTTPLAMLSDPYLVWNYGVMGCIVGIGGIILRRGVGEDYLAGLC